MKGRSVEEYRAPLFIAWQLTNRCGARCITCCEESGPDNAWRDELRRDEALDLARRIAAFGVAYHGGILFPLIVVAAQIFVFHCETGAPPCSVFVPLFCWSV